MNDRLAAVRLISLIDEPLPSRRLTAPIQILNTARALAGLGASVTIACGPIEDDDGDRVLAFYGLQPHPNLELRPALHLEHVDADAEGLVIMARGEEGLRRFPEVRSALPSVPFVYEAHHVRFLAMADRRAGTVRGWLGGKVRARRVHARERATVEGADGLVCLTEGVRDGLARHFELAGRPTLVLPSGVALPADEDGASRAPDDRDIDILYAGKLLDRKGLPILIDALALLPERSAWIVGGSEEDVARVRRFARARGIPDERLHLPGHVEPGRVGAFYRRARVGVCPLPARESSISERFTSPLKVLEMMAHGVPVVASDLPSTRALLTADETAVLVAPNDAPALAAALRRVLAEPDLADRLARRAREEAGRYTWDVRARRLLAFLESLVGAA